MHDTTNHPPPPAPPPEPTPPAQEGRLVRELALLHPAIRIILLVVGLAWAVAAGYTIECKLEPIPGAGPLGH